MRFSPGCGCCGCPVCASMCGLPFPATVYLTFHVSTGDPYIDFLDGFSNPMAATGGGFPTGYHYGQYVDPGGQWNVNSQVECVTHANCNLTTPAGPAVIASYAVIAVAHPTGTRYYTFKLPGGCNPGLGAGCCLRATGCPCAPSQLAVWEGLVVQYTPPTGPPPIVVPGIASYVLSV
jgi:hypothetical protein